VPDQNPFAAHGITHLSPSSMNRWASQPALFVLEKILKRSSPVGPGAHRGTAAEAGIAHGLVHPSASLDECIAIAQSKFSELTALSTDPRTEKESANLAGYVTVGLQTLRPYGVPTSLQGEIRMAFDGIAVPVLGFYDFMWQSPTGTILIDLKTSGMLSSQISTAHARQVAFYASAIPNCDARVAYVTPKKSAVYGLENVEAHRKALHNIAASIQAFLSISEDPQVLTKLVVPDVDSFYFNDPLTRQAAFEVWGI